MGEETEVKGGGPDARLVVELHGDTPEVAVSWTPGVDPGLFAELLIRLQAGALSDEILASIDLVGESSGLEGDAAAIREAFHGLIEDLDDEPVVCPTEAVARLMHRGGD